MKFDLLWFNLVALDGHSTGHSAIINKIPYKNRTNAMVIPIYFVKMTFSLKKRKRIKGYELFAPTSINPGTRRALSDTYINIYIYIFIYIDVCIIYMLNYFDGHSMAPCQEIKCIVRTNTNAMSLPIYLCKVYICDGQKHKRIQRYANFCSQIHKSRPSTGTLWYIYVQTYANNSRNYDKAHQMKLNVFCFRRWALLHGFWIDERSAIGRPWAFSHEPGAMSQEPCAMHE